MADPTPLLCQSNTELPPPPPTNYNQHQHLPSLGSTVEKIIGEFNWTQFLQAFLVSFAWVFDAQQTFITVFTDAHPPWHCTQQDVPGSCNNNNDNMCRLSKDLWAWDRPTESSIISEWALECASPFVTGLPASLFFMGCLVGGIVLATLADTSVGRKNMLFFSCLMMSLSSLLASFSTNIWIYSFLKFLSGFGRATVGTSSLVLASELVGKKRRAQICVFGFFFFTVGFLSLPAMAYVNRFSSWRNLYLWTSISTILYCVAVKLFVQESPRWLLVRGKKEEALETLKSITSITQSKLNLAINGLTLQEEENQSADLYSALRILLEQKWSSRRLLAVMAMGFGIGLVYYGMPLGLENLSFNLYLSVTFNALSELPSSMIVFFMIDKFRRRIALLMFTIISGVFSVISIVEFVSSEVQIGFELVSFFAACSSFNIYLIYTTELFPTCVRNSALSMARLAVVFGGVFSPLVVGAGGGGRGLVCYGIFGVAIGCSGVFGVLLPETKGRVMCDTMDEEENKDKTNFGVDVLA